VGLKSLDHLDSSLVQSTIGRDPSIGVDLAFDVIVNQINEIIMEVSLSVNAITVVDGVDFRG
jgi:hypothetical protein